MLIKSLPADNLEMLKRDLENGDFEMICGHNSIRVKDYFVVLC